MNARNRSTEAARTYGNETTDIHYRYDVVGNILNKSDYSHWQPGAFSHASRSANTAVLQGEVWVHHAVERQVQKRYSGLVKDSEMHSLENLRGIPKEINNDVHFSKIRKEWNSFYKTNPNPTKQQLLDKATEIDDKFGKQFNPPVR